MINVTNGQLVLRKSATDLHLDILESIRGAASALLKMHDLESLDLAKVTTKTHIIVSYSKFMLCYTSLQVALFDESYIRNAWDVYQSRSQDVTPEQFYRITLSGPEGQFAYRQTYVQAFKRGLGLFFLTLHSRGAITLPIGFVWPAINGKAGSWAHELNIFNELLSFLRSLESSTEILPHPAFRSVGANRKRREWFLCYGTKLLLATGWLKPQDAQIADLRAIKYAESNMGVGADVLAYKALIDVLRERYGEAFSITVDDWAQEIRSISNDLMRTEGQMWLRLEKAFTKVGELDADLIGEIIKAPPSMAQTKVLRDRLRLPGLNVDLKTIGSKWFDLQDAYVQYSKKESYKGALLALGYLNIYLFFYLPFWFQRRPHSELEFPDEPQKLRASVFVSRLLNSHDQDLPITLVEYLDAQSKYRKWAQNSHYALLKQVEVFFAFLERNSDELPGCRGFRQPIPDYAYPKTYNSKGTNKRPIPRRAFRIFLDYVEAVKAHLEVVLERILNGELDSGELVRYLYRSTRDVIDTFATSSLVGFIPVIFHKGKTIPLQYIPNRLYMKWFPVAGGRNLKLPQPHAYNQILVSLYTGLRQNHIQWLDVRHFDAGVAEDVGDFALLHVNTDKSMQNAWTPHVNFRVIEILRDQRKWRRLIRLPGFEKQCFYNDNPNTKWPLILPLFSYDEQGRPHPDVRYERVWRDVLCSVDAILQSIGATGMQRLFTLEPPGVSMDDPARDSKRREYGSKCKKVCELKVQTKITPHSARVTVVSQYSTILPTETIGSHITGQTPGMVYHYVVLDDEDLRSAQTHQAMRLRDQAHGDSTSSWGKARPKAGQFFRADDVNSNLSQSLRKNLQETLVSYGCISITMTEGETSGLDVLRETRAASAAENKTEICPYGNQCPPEIIKQWRGGQRCGLCQYAVRSVDHLPAVSAKVKEFAEMLEDLTLKVEESLSSDLPRYTDEELDRLDEERSRLAEELTGWRLNEEILDAARVRIAEGQDDRRWVVQKPEIILKDLQRVRVPNNLTAYLITRLEECITFPTCESPQIRARFDVMRRNLLAQTGQTKKAFDMRVPANPAAECAGLLRTLVESNQLRYEDIVDLLDGNAHLDGLSFMNNQLLLEGKLP